VQGSADDDFPPGGPGLRPPGAPMSPTAQPGQSSQTGQNDLTGPTGPTGLLRGLAARALGQEASLRSQRAAALPWRAGPVEPAPWVADAGLLRAKGAAPPDDAHAPAATPHSGVARQAEPLLRATATPAAAVGASGTPASTAVDRPAAKAQASVQQPVLAVPPPGRAKGALAQAVTPLGQLTPPTPPTPPTPLVPLTPSAERTVEVAVRRDPGAWGPDQFNPTPLLPAATQAPATAFASATPAHSDRRAASPAAQSPREVHISIGRVELTALAASPSAPSAQRHAPRREPGDGRSLAEYLRAGAPGRKDRPA